MGMGSTIVPLKWERAPNCLIGMGASENTTFSHLPATHSKLTSLPKLIWEQGCVAKVSPSGTWAVRHCAVARIHQYACYDDNFAAKAEGLVEQSLRFC